MKYDAPVDENNKPYYVPVVAKNRDYLLGYIKGINEAKEILSDIFYTLSIDLELPKVDVILDSTRYNDILENGQKESDMSDDELEQYISNLIDEFSVKMSSDNLENNVFDDAILKVECSCGFGFQYWENECDIPDDNFICSNCGKLLIHYTNINEYEYEFDEGL